MKRKGKYSVNTEQKVYMYMDSMEKECPVQGGVEGEKSELKS